MSSYESSARLVKAYRLATVFDTMVREQWSRVEVGDDGADSEVPCEPMDVVNLARLWSKDEWTTLAQASGINPPSDRTIELIITILENRVPTTPEDPFASFRKDKT